MISVNTILWGVRELYGVIACLSLKLEGSNIVSSCSKKYSLEGHLETDMVIASFPRTGILQKRI